VKPNLRALVVMTFAAGVAGGLAGVVADHWLPDTTPARRFVVAGAGLFGNAVGLYWAVRR
jgi:hypothetical protein